MRSKNIILLFIFFMFYLSGCGETAVSTYQQAGVSPQFTTSDYIIVAPTQPPFIIFDGNIGEIDQNLTN